MDVTWYNYEISWESSGEEWWIMALIMDTFFVIFYGIYPMIIKHGLLENHPFIDYFPAMNLYLNRFL